MILEQRAYVIMRDGCPVRISIEQDDYVEIVCGGSRDENFEFVLHKEVLRSFVDVCSGALERMDQQPTQQPAQQPSAASAAAPTSAASSPS